MEPDAAALDEVRAQLAPTGTLRVGINASNFLLVTGETPDGEPDGVSPGVGRAIAAELDLPIELVPYAGPGELADAVADDVWDLANIAAEPERARTIRFGPAYCEIQATCLLPPGSALRTFAELDAPGVRVAVKARAAYDLWLTEHLRHARLVRAPSIDDSFRTFVDEGLEALAGLRPKLLEQRDALPGSVLLEEPFTAVRQSIGCRPGLPEAAGYLDDFVARAIRSGLIAGLIERHGVTGRLSVPAD